MAGVGYAHGVRLGDRCLHSAGAWGGSGLRTYVVDVLTAEGELLTGRPAADVIARHPRLQANAALLRDREELHRDLSRPGPRDRPTTELRTYCATTWPWSAHVVATAQQSVVGADGRLKSASVEKYVLDLRTEGGTWRVTRLRNPSEFGTGAQTVVCTQVAE